MNHLTTLNIEDFANKPLITLGKWMKNLNRFVSSANRYSPVKQFSEIGAQLESQSHIFDASTLLSIADLEGNFTFANDNFCRVSKYSLEELIGKHHSIIHHPETPKSFFSEMRNTLKTGKIWNGETKSLAKDGTPYWVKETIAPVMGENGRPVKYISMRMDITKQKEVEWELCEMKKKLDMDLIQNVNSAEHVHKAFLSSEEHLMNTFPDSFLIYQAQKIISGDFYRVEQKNGTSVILFGDSTGHGVSASYVSHLAMGIFNRSLSEGLLDPSQILKKMNDEIHEILHTDKNNHIIESADSIICTLDHKENIFKYSSANIKSILVRNGQIIEMERQRSSIGDRSSNQSYFHDHEIKLEKGDCIYLFSDGMQDQFGGPKNKKFSYKSLIRTLGEINTSEMKEQKKMLAKTLNLWKGSNEQTDDMSMIGIKFNNL